MSHSSRYLKLFENVVSVDAYCNQDLSLVTALKSPIQLKEYLIIDDPGFTNQDFSKATLIGKTNSQLGMLDVYRVAFTNSTIWYALVNSEIGPIAPLCYISFEFKEGLPLLRKNSYCQPQYRGKGLISELNLFVAKIEHESMISDTMMTISGEKVWEKMINRYPNNCGIFHGPTKTVFSFDKIGTKQNGILVIDPKKDKLSIDYWFKNPTQGQKWFYIFQSFNEPPITEDDHMRFNSIKRNLHSYQPYPAFGEGYE